MSGVALLLLASLAAASTPVVTWDLEQDDGGFDAGGELDQWQWGAVRAGPGAGYDGANAWGIGLSGAYLNDATEYLEIPLPGLAGLADPAFRFAHWHLLGTGDYGYVEIDDGGGFLRATPIYDYPAAEGWSGASAGWVQASFSLAGLSDTVRLRLVFVSDPANVGTGWYVDQVGLYDGDVTAPRGLALDALPDTENLDGPYTVGAQLTDDTGVDEATLHYVAGGGDEVVVPMVADGLGGWSGSIDGQLPDTTVRYWVEASDGANSTRYPEGDDRSFRVYLPAPTDLAGPSGRVVAAEAVLSWTAPVSIHAVLGYQVERGGTPIGESATTSATVELLGEFDEFDVRAIYAEGVGDPSESIGVDAVVPQILSLVPDEAWSGDSFRLSLYGEYLLLVDGGVGLDLGEGSAVEGMDVRDVDHLIATVRFDDDALPGPRTVTVASEVGTVQFVDGFTLLPPDDRPALVSLSPEKVKQGDQGELVLRTQGAVGDELTVDLGTGIVVETAVRDGDSIVVTYAVAPNSPLGDHAVTVDDQTRVLDGLVLEVKDYSPPSISTCSATAPLVAPLAVAMSLLALQRRRSPSAGC